MSKDYINKLHNISAYEESLTWGKFRDNEVRIGGTEYTPPNNKELDNKWNNLLEEAEKISEIYQKAILVFLQIARNKFFFHSNTKTGRIMMNGILLQDGYPIINVPAKRKVEFNQLMIEFYESNQIDKMYSFLLSCLPDNIIEMMS